MPPSILSKNEIRCLAEIAGIAGSVSTDQLLPWVIANIRTLDHLGWITSSYLVARDSVAIYTFRLVLELGLEVSSYLLEQPLGPLSVQDQEWITDTSRARGWG